MTGMIDYDVAWEYYNPNPAGKRVGDCVIRAICKATGKDWQTVFAELMVKACALCDMPSANYVWGAYLKSMGYRRHLIDDHAQNIYTVVDFCLEHPRGTYILCIDGHVVCVQDGHIFDTWDSGGEIPVYYWEKSNE